MKITDLLKQVIEHVKGSGFDYSKYAMKPGTYHEHYMVGRPKLRQIEMGHAVNCLTNMLMEGDVSDEEIQRVEEYIVIVLDANKHMLDYMQANKDLGIDGLRKKHRPNKA